MVAGTASHDDPALTNYWAQRRRRGKPPLNSVILRLLRRQDGRCTLCGGLLLHTDEEPQTPEQWAQWLTATRKAIRKHAVTTDAGSGTPNETHPYLLHAFCRSRTKPAGAQKPQPCDEP